MADIKQYFPDIVSDIKEFKAIDIAETPEINISKAAYEAVMKEQFLDTIGEYGCKRWETMLGIFPKASDTLEERRFRIRSKLNDYLPYTWNSLGKMLDSLCGNDGYEKERVPGEFSVAVRVGLGNKKKYDIIKDMIESIVPVNMITDVSLLYNRHYEVGRYKNSKLSSYTHDDIRQRRLPVYNLNSEAGTHIHSVLAKNKHERIRAEPLKEYSRHINIRYLNSDVARTTHNGLREKGVLNK